MVKPFVDNKVIAGSNPTRIKGNKEDWLSGKAIGLNLIK